MAAKHKGIEPSNTAIKESMEDRYPNWEFVVCEVCHNWCVVLEEIEGGFHPLCVGTGRHRTIMYARRRAMKGSESLF